MAGSPRSLNADKLSSMDAGEQVIDKYGTRWVKTDSGEWLSSALTFSSSKEVASRRATQPGWIAADSKVL